METVDVMIRIPKRTYDRVSKRGIIAFGEDAYYIGHAIENGTVLPKGHGRLISTNDLDITKLVDSDIEWVMGRCDISRVHDMIDNATTIIEADKDDEDGR